MSDAAITVIVTGAIQITGLIIGFLVLWVRLKYGNDQAEKAASAAISANDQAVKAATAATVAVGAVEEKTETIVKKLDENTATTESVNSKATTIAKATNGVIDRLTASVASLGDRLNKLESYSHDTAHRLLNAVNMMHLKLTELSALIPRTVVVKDTPVTVTVKESANNP